LCLFELAVSIAKYLRCNPGQGVVIVHLPPQPTQVSVPQNWYNHRRGHFAREHLPAIRDSDSPPTFDLSTQKFVCVEELGGHLKSYRAAA
jgi:hypothetical protein